ncbi:MAG: hypothetical protein QOG21_2209 [Actinomycetota bacterium]|nr:hypothetical protein [Actinomycetota bacterium]
MGASMHPRTLMGIRTLRRSKTQRSSLVAVAGALTDRDRFFFQSFFEHRISTDHQARELDFLGFHAAQTGLLRSFRLAVLDRDLDRSSLRSSGGCEHPPLRSRRSRCHLLLPHCRSALSRRPVAKAMWRGRAVWDQAG